MAQGFSRRRAILVDPDTGEPLSVKDRVLHTSDSRARRMMAKVWLEWRKTLELMRPLDLEEGLGIKIQSSGRKRKISQLGDEVEWLLIPELRDGGGATRAAQSNYDGAAYITPVPISFDRFLFRVTTGGTGTLRFAFYQSLDGGGGIANLLGSATSLGGSAATFTVDARSMIVQPGIVYVLWGALTGGSAPTLATWTVPTSFNLVLVNVDPTTHAPIFTTTLDVDSLPTSFDPRDQTVSTSSLAPVLRLVNTKGLA